MTQEKFKRDIESIRAKAKITSRMADAVDSTSSPTIHTLWKYAGELNSMVTALKSEMAGNDEPKRG